MPVLRFLLLILAVVLPTACTPLQLLEPRADAAQTVTGTRPYLWAHVVLGSTTDWDPITLPSWVRQCLVIDEHATGTLLVGNPGETGAVSTTNDEYGTVFPQGAVVVVLSAGQSQAPSSHLVVPLASTTASLPVGLFCTESAL